MRQVVAYVRRDHAAPPDAENATRVVVGSVKKRVLAGIPSTVRTARTPLALDAENKTAAMLAAAAASSALSCYRAYEVAPIHK